MEILKLKNTITKIKISAEGLKSRMEGTEERIAELEGRKREITQFEQQTKYTGKKWAEPQGPVRL